MEEENQNLSQLAEEAKKKKDFYLESALILILGVLVGIALKTEAVKKITIGFDDYKMKFYQQDYSINKLQDEQIKKISEQSQEREGAENK